MRPILYLETISWFSFVFFFAFLGGGHHHKWAGWRCEVTHLLIALTTPLLLFCLLSVFNFSSFFKAFSSFPFS